MLNEFRGRLEELSKNFSKHIANIKTEVENIKHKHKKKNKKVGNKSTLTEIKNYREKQRSK